MVCMFLVVATLAVYWKVQNHDFVNYDDHLYVIDNRHVQAGFTREGIIWAFTTIHASNWHPLTWLSHMLDCQIYGLNAGGHHLTNLLFHIVNTLLLFIVLKRMTGALWRSGLVAALFALHPLHVESVAWVAERKDVLSTFFWMLTMWAYVRYVERPGLNTYFFLLLFFILGLMSKPMLVTLPFVLLLMDYFPLGRLQLGQYSKKIYLGIQESPVIRLLWEKAPLFALAAASCVVTLHAQQSGGALASLDKFPLNIRIANALVSYVSYMGKTIWPRRLAVLYPHADMLPVWQAALAGLLLVCISILVIRAARRFPYLAVGWLWYLGTLVPVIGVVQVGAQSMADRYTYIPLIGLFIIIAWGVADLAARWRFRELVLAMSVGLVLLAFGIFTWLQVRHWHNSVALFKHTLNVTANNYVAHNNLGLVLARGGSLKEAISHYYQALEINPNYAYTHNNLGIALAEQGRADAAISHYSVALRIKPDYAEVHNNLGVELALQGSLKEAIDHFSEALRLKPDCAKAHNNLGFALAERGRLDEAISHYSKALHINPDYSEAHNNLGFALAEQGRLEEAIGHYSEAVRIKPDDAEAHYNIGALFGKMGYYHEELHAYKQAIRLKPNYAKAYCNLGAAYAQIGRYSKAVSAFEEAVRLNPDDKAAQQNLKMAYEKIKNQKTDR